MNSRCSGAKCLLTLLLIAAVANLSIAQKPILTVPSGHSAWITDYEVSRDGKYLVTGAYDNTLKLWDYASGRELTTLSGHKDVIQSVAFSPDSRTIASSAYDGTIKFWDIATGKLKHTWYSLWRRNNEMQFSPDGNSLLFTSDSSCVLYDLKADSARWWIKTLGKAGKARFFQHGERVALLDWMRTGEQSDITVYDAKSGEPIEDLGFSYIHGDIMDFEFSLSGRYLFAVVDTDSLNVRVHDMVTGRDSKRLHGHKNHPQYVSPAENDSTFYSIYLSNELFNGRTEIKRWNWYQSKCTDSTTIYHDGKRGELFSYQFVPVHHQLLVPVSSTIIQQHHSNTLQRLGTFSGHSHLTNMTVALPGKLVMTNDDCSVKELDLQRGELNIPVQRPFPDKNFTITRIFMARDSNSFYYTSPASRYVQRWQKNRKPSVIHTAEGRIAASDFNAAMQQLVLYSIPSAGPGQLSVTDTTGRVLARKELPWKNRTSHTLLSFSGDDRVLLRIWNVDSLILWDYKKNALSFIPDAKGNQHWHAAVLDRDRVLLEGYHGSFELVNLTKGIWEKRWKADSSSIASLKLNADRTKLIVGLYNGDVRILNTKDWKVEKTFHANNSAVTEVGFMPDEKMVYTSGMDNMLHFWNLRTNEVLASVVVVDTSEWVVIKKGGLFDASAKAMKLIYYVVNDSLDKDEPWKIIQLDQLKHRYYQPGLLPIQLGFSKEVLREVPAIENIELSPKLNAWIDGTTLKIRLTDQRGGIGPVSIYLNDAEIVADVRTPEMKTKPGRELEISFNLKPYFNRMPSGTSEIKVIAWNRKEWIRSNPTVVTFAPLKTSKGIETEVVENRKSHKPRLFGVVVGTSEYAGHEIDLRYASKDARDFYLALQAASENLFGKENSILTLLTTEEKDVKLHPTKKNIAEIFSKITAQIKPDDILIVYFSGHGVSVSGDNGDFFYATMQTSGLDLANMKDPAIQQRVGLSSTELTAVFNKITAMKKILILDACNSGKAAETMTTQVKDIPASQVRALDRMKDRTGFYVLSGSAADAVSYESSVYGQGLLTYSLLKAMKGAALRIDGGEEYVDVQKLFYYAVEQVPVLAAGIGGIQKPLYRSPDDQRSFDIGKVDDQIKRAIVISEPKPVFMASAFQDQLQLFDVIGLSDAVNAGLRDIASKGKQAELIFTEAKDYPGSYRVSGNYREEGDEFVISYVIIKDKKVVGGPKEFRHEKADVKVIAEALLMQLKNALQ